MHPFSAALRDIARIPGARYSCVADDVTGELLAEQGRPDPDPATAVRWGSRLRVALRPSGELEDVMVTTAGTYHLLRLVRADERAVLVHVSVDRAHGNLALARRALGKISFTRLVPQEIDSDPPSPAASGPLPVRTPRRPAPAGAGGRPAASLSAVPPPRRPVVLPPARPAPAPADLPADPGPDPRIAVPEARGWSDDLYTMRRLLDGLRRMR